MVSARFRRATIEELLGLVQQPVVSQEACAAGYPGDGTRFFALRTLERGTADDDVFGMYHVLDEAGIRVGHVGFHGGPDAELAVRIGYAIASHSRRQGFGRAAVDWLVQLTRDLEDVRLIRADTAVDNVGSQRILERAGFGLLNANGQSLFYELRIHSPPS